MWFHCRVQSLFAVSMAERPVSLSLLVQAPPFCVRVLSPLRWGEKGHHTALGTQSGVGTGHRITPKLTFVLSPGGTNLGTVSGGAMLWAFLENKCIIGCEVLRCSAKEGHVSTSTEWVCLSSHHSDLQSSLPRETSCSSAIYDPPP